MIDDIASRLSQISTKMDDEPIRDAAVAEIRRLQEIVGRIRAALGLTPDTEPAHARHNLDAAYDDLRKLTTDAVCLRTIDRVIRQLVVVENILEEPEDD